MKSIKGCFLEHNSSFIETNQNLNSNLKFDYAFTINPKSTPRIIRKCARCDANRFVSSDKFRINANKKIIDVWLVFKCVSCDYTLNVTIISRKSVASVERTLLNRFHENDVGLVWKYAFDPSYIERGHQVDWEIVFDVEPTDIILYDDKCKNIENKGGGSISLLIQSNFFLKVPIYAILRKILNTSRSQLEKIHAKGGIKIWTMQGKSMSLKSSMGFACSIKLII